MKKTMKQLVAFVLAVMMVLMLTTASADVKKSRKKKSNPPAVTETVVQAPAEEEKVVTPAPVAETDPALGKDDAPGSVRIKIRNAGKQLYYGDKVTLEAEVKNVEGRYTVLWQYKAEDNEWKTVHKGEEYTFTLTEETAAREYRALVVTGKK